MHVALCQQNCWIRNHLLTSTILKPDQQWETCELHPYQVQWLPHLFRPNVLVFHPFQPGCPLLQPQVPNPNKTIIRKMTINITLNCRSSCKSISIGIVCFGFASASHKSNLQLMWKQNRFVVSSHVLMRTRTTTPSKHITCVPIELFCVQCPTLVTSSVTTVALDPICVIPIHKTNPQQQPPPTHKHKFLNAYQTREDTRSKPWEQKQQQQQQP